MGRFFCKIIAKNRFVLYTFYRIEKKEKGIIVHGKAGIAL